MNKPDILHIINQGENETLEFKSNFNNETIISLSAFANTKGGRVLIGISDRGIKGVSLNNESVKSWINEVKQKTEPSIIPDAQTITIDKKTIVILSVQEFPIKPVSARGRYFIRKNNSNHLLSLDEINNLYHFSLQTSWDSYEYKGADKDSLDFEKVQLFIKKVNNSGRFRLSGKPLECLTKLRLVINNKPTNAAMILFSKEELFFNVHVGRFKTPSYIIDDKMFRGNLFDIVEDTMRYIIGQIKVAFEFTGAIQRNEIFEYPIHALRELVLNAIVHRDYTNPTDIQIKIFDNSISIFNPGKLFGGITVEELKTNHYQSRTRNKLIAESFYLTKDIEKYGSGYIRVREAISEYPTMNFDYEETGDGFLVTLTYTHQKTTSEVVENGELNGELNIGQATVYQLIKKQTGINATEISKQLKMPFSTVDKHIRVLLKKGLIERRGSKKTGGYFVIK
jgi:ATP-dependent DNA helicase RecG